MTKVIFSHGQESGPWGTKIRAMAETVRSMGFDADSVDYQGIADPTERVEKLVLEAQIGRTAHPRRFEHGRPRRDRRRDDVGRGGPLSARTGLLYAGLRGADAAGAGDSHMDRPRLA